EGWTETRCSQVCPTDAIKLHLVDDAEVEAMVAAEGLERYRDSLGTKPRVYYKNLHRWEKAFVACSVVFGDTDECAEGATLTVAFDGGALGEATADVFGEVLVDHLEPGREYSLRIEAAGYRPAEMTVRVDASVNAGTVVLEKA
ncbi:MAG TPA: oxidoreductase, partial [Thermoleophilia bacterium]|nr:oxidoreductase [Thermoleophilia bacterium]